MYMVTERVGGGTKGFMLPPSKIYVGHTEIKLQVTANTCIFSNLVISVS